MAENTKLLLNENEAAQMLGMSSHFLRRDRISKTSVGIPFLRIGGAVRYRQSDIETWIAIQIKKTQFEKIEEKSITTVLEKRQRGRPKKISANQNG